MVYPNLILTFWKFSPIPFRSLPQTSSTEWICLMPSFKIGFIGRALSSSCTYRISFYSACCMLLQYSPHPWPPWPPTSLTRIHPTTKTTWGNQAAVSLVVSILVHYSSWPCSFMSPFPKSLTAHLYYAYGMYFLFPMAGVLTFSGWSQISSLRFCNHLHKDLVGILPHLNCHYVKLNIRAIWENGPWVGSRHDSNKGQANVHQR